MDAIPSFPNLTPDDRIWRLDWFGECTYPSRVQRYAQPSLKVVLSSLRCDPSDLSVLPLPNSTDHQHPHEAWIPISALPLLVIGDLWQQGHQIASPDYQTESFKGLRISPETTSFVKAGLAIDEHFLLPLSQHPWHRLHTQSYCVAVTLGSGGRLLVPCVEIIRFYFGSSSNFLQRLFTAPLTTNALWTSKRFNPANKHLHLVLANRLSGVSAADIGRIAENKCAWRSAAGIFASCQKASAQRHPAYPYTGFPFEGTTNLEASGIWLPFGERENATFLAYRLRSCSHPFPFTSLSYEAADRNIRHGTTGGDKAESKKFSHGRAKVKNEAADVDPGSNKTQRTSSFYSQHRFPDLARKQVWREKIEAMPKADVYLRRADGSLEQVAFGEGDGYSEIAGMNAAQSVKEGSISLPRFVQAGLKIIAKTPEYSRSDAQVKPVCLPGKTNPVFSLPVVIDENGEIASDLLFIGVDGSTRQRHACFVEVCTHAMPQRYLVIIEGCTRTAEPEILATTRVEMAEAPLLVLKDERTFLPQKSPQI